MKRIVLCGIALLTVAPVYGQTAPTTNAANAPVTMTGCVGSSADASGFTLGNAMVVPGTAQPGQTNPTSSPLPPAATAPATQPTGAAPVPPATAAVPPPTQASPGAVPPPASAAQVPPAAAAGAVPPSATAAQTPATGSPATAAAVGTSGATPTSVTGTSGTVSGGATSSMTSGTTGYHLSGTDMTSWAGQRVQVVGTFAPASATPAGTTSVGQPGSPAAPPLVFRVQSVQPVSGPCPR